jgi:hypothetical protein
MIRPTDSRLAELLADREGTTEAIRRGIREAVLEHARAGRAVPVWENGKVVWLQPEEVLKTLAPTEPDQSNGHKSPPVDSTDA